jgi:hypothetical protein
VIGNEKHRLVGAPRFELGTSCAQGRRATRLRYAPTLTALFILKHFPTMLLLRFAIFASCQNCAKYFHWIVPVPESSGISLAWRLLQGFPFHLQLHLRILFEDLASPCRRSWVIRSSTTPPALSRVA